VLLSVCSYEQCFVDWEEKWGQLDGGDRRELEKAEKMALLGEKLTAFYLKHHPVGH
jgi:hypothetical protein